MRRPPGRTRSRLGEGGCGLRRAGRAAGLARRRAVGRVVDGRAAGVRLLAGGAGDARRDLAPLGAGGRGAFLAGL
ncbi:MAG TPA: hypothetical protein VM388_09400, partial [Acidimicrobiales bacterium]|nr:hypothetical protein [Acidimicrobiales bacterium]